MKTETQTGATMKPLYTILTSMTLTLAFTIPSYSQKSPPLNPLAAEEDNEKGAITMDAVPEPMEPIVDLSEQMGRISESKEPLSARELLGGVEEAREILDAHERLASVLNQNIFTVEMNKMMESIDAKSTEDLLGVSEEDEEPLNVHELLEKIAPRYVQKPAPLTPSSTSNKPRLATDEEIASIASWLLGVVETIGTLEKHFAAPEGAGTSRVNEHIGNIGEEDGERADLLNPRKRQN